MSLTLTKFRILKFTPVSALGVYVPNNPSV